MTVTITESISVRERARAIGCVVPQKLALIPHNFSLVENSSELLQPSEAATIRTLFRNNQIPLESLFSKSQTPGYIQNNAFEWISPAIFIGAGLISENPSMISLALSVLANYVTDFFKGVPGNNKVKLEFIVEQSDNYTCKTLKYEGDIAGISSLNDAILRIANE